MPEEHMLTESELKFLAYTWSTLKKFKKTIR